MESVSLLPELQALPVVQGVAELAPAEMLSRVRAMDRGNFAMEVSFAVEEGMEALFDARNVDDHLAAAHSAVFPDAASDYGSLHDHYQEMLSRGEGSVTGFVSAVKGRLAEFKAESVLEERFTGFNFTLAPDPTQAVWDLRGVGPEGKEVLVQVKTGGAGYAGEVLERMEEAPNVMFAVSSNLYAELTERAPELQDRLIDIGVANHEFTETAKEGLATLAGNMGIDVPDSLGEVLPYVGEVVLGIKLIQNIVSTERALKGVALSDRSRVHGVRALALMSRFGVTSVFASAGTATGGPVGGLAGGGAAMMLNRMLQPRIEEVAIRLVGGDADDMFYLMNKQAIDEIGASLAATAAAFA